ncbi:SCO6880 family protein, partial [Sporichthya polymorpha]|uniref:SCO6880 family protein n=1 Tax=Sporichthya polymorpha TaxID=35751 RepID=UPI0003807564
MTVPEVRFGRLERRGLLLGLSAVQVALVGIALVLVVAAGIAAGPLGVLLSAPAWAAALAWALVPVGGRPLIEVFPTFAAWATRRLTHRHLDLAAPDVPIDLSSIAVPGLPGRLRLTADQRGAALIRPARPLGGPVTMVAEVRGRGFLLESAATQDRRVAAWGRLLDSLCQTPDVIGAQVLHRSVPHAGTHLRHWWAGQVSSASPWAARIVDDLVRDSATDTGLQNLVAVAVRPRRADLDATRVALRESLETSELDLLAWLTPSQIAELVRLAYDPASAFSSFAGTRSGGCGPMGVAEQWSHARSDTAFHVTYWVSEWPRAATHSSFLRPLLLGGGADVGAGAGGVQLTFTLLARPLPPGKSLREIRRARAEQVADAATRARIGRVEEETHRAAAAELTRREQDLVAGHGDLHFTGLLAVSAPSQDALTESCAAVETAAAQAGCELRRLVGRQVQAYAAAALPLARW